MSTPKDFFKAQGRLAGKAGIGVQQTGEGWMGKVQNPRGLGDGQSVGLNDFRSQKSARMYGIKLYTVRLGPGPPSFDLCGKLPDFVDVESSELFVLKNVDPIGGIDIIRQTFRNKVFFRSIIPSLAKLAEHR